MNRLSKQQRRNIIIVSILFLAAIIAGIVMMIKNPSLLKSRLDAKEKEQEQKDVVRLSGLMFLVGFIIAGLNYRFDLTHLPKCIIIISSIIFIISYIIYAEVLRENTFLSRTIGVKKNQQIIDTGLYGIVRHPMYLATLFLFLTMPLILDSQISFIVFFVKSKYSSILVILFLSIIMHLLYYYVLYEKKKII